MNQQDEFKKAVRKDIGESIFGIYISFLIMLFGYAFYSLDKSISLMIMVIGIAIFSGSFVGIINCIDYKHHPEKCSLCKRCKCLIKKDKIFCDNCRNKLRRVINFEEDKKLSQEYSKVIKQEKKHASNL